MGCFDRPSDDERPVRKVSGDKTDPCSHGALPEGRAPPYFATTTGRPGSDSGYPSPRTARRPEQARCGVPPGAPELELLEGGEAPDGRRDGRRALGAQAVAAARRGGGPRQGRAQRPASASAPQPGGGPVGIRLATPLVPQQTDNCQRTPPTVSSRDGSRAFNAGYRPRLGENAFPGPARWRGRRAP